MGVGFSIECQSQDVDFMTQGDFIGDMRNIPKQLAEAMLGTYEDFGMVDGETDLLLAMTCGGVGVSDRIDMDVRENGEDSFVAASLHNGKFDEFKKGEGVATNKFDFFLNWSSKILEEMSKRLAKKMGPDAFWTKQGERDAIRFFKADGNLVKDYYHDGSFDYEVFNANFHAELARAGYEDPSRRMRGSKPTLVLNHPKNRYGFGAMVTVGSGLGKESKYDPRSNAIDILARVQLYANAHYNRMDKSAASALSSLQRMGFRDLFEADDRKTPYSDLSGERVYMEKLGIISGNLTVEQAVQSFVSMAEPLAKQELGNLWNAIGYLE